MTSSSQRQIALWLFGVCFLVFCMVILGGVTRLTGSGLSMVEWHPVSGVLPPIGDAAWLAEFDSYRQSPEFKIINSWMTLGDFKQIFWFEFSHRLLGRIIGLAFLVPFLWFLWKGHISRSLRPKLIVMFILGGLQGVLGWYMVKSGLVNNPHVSQYRLTAHLMAAIAIYGYMLWVALGLYGNNVAQQSSDNKARVFALGLAVLIVITLVSGGFVAGLKAGLVYNTFPLMNGEFIPEGIGALSPWYLNLFENMATVQFDHRLLAITTLYLVLVFWLKQRRSALPDTTRFWVNALAAMALLQVFLGVSTLLLRVPVPLASLHQAGAMVLFTIIVVVNHRLRYTKQNNLEGRT